MKVVKQDIKLREESLVHVETLVKTSLMSLEDKRGKSSVKGNKSKSKSPYIGKSYSRGTGLNVDTPLPPPPPPLNTEQLEPRLSPQWVTYLLYPLHIGYRPIPVICMLTRHLSRLILL